LPYQEHFLSFAVGDLKTKITKYHNKNLNIDDYFIKIMKVSDSIGHVWGAPNRLEAGFHTDSTLRVGDRLEFLIDAFDPKGRQIIYELNCGRLNQKNDDVKFIIEITKEMISIPASFHFTVSTEESDYENNAKFSVFYTVLP
jgi:hypothetical protein